MYDLSNNNLGLDDEDPTTPPSSFIQYFTTSVFYKKEYALIDKYVSSVREALKKLYILWQPANFNCHPT